MTTMTQLFKMVTANDYEGLEKIVQSKSKADFNCVKSGISLLYRAIEFRSRECFDILMNIPELDLLNKSGHLSGFSIALDYYMQAPNPSNEYYINTLMEKNVKVDSYTLNKLINFPHLFNIVFDRVEKNENLFSSIITHAIANNNLQMMHQMFSILEDNNYIFYNQDTKQLFNTRLLLYVIEYTNNIDALNLLVNKGVNWKYINKVGTSTPTLYLAKNTNNNHMFNAIYALYEKLSPEEINQIPNIKNYQFKASGNFPYVVEYTNKIFKLPIEFNNTAPEILKYVRQLIGEYYWYGSVNKREKELNDNLQCIYTLYKSGSVKSNPFYSSPNSPLLSINDIDNWVKKLSQRQTYWECYKRFFRNLVYICSHNGHSFTDKLKEKIDAFYTPEQLVTFEADKKTYIDSFNTVTVQITKKTRKPKAKVQNEIEV